MKYYAIQWTYGRAVDGHGSRVGSYYQFDSKNERDGFVADGNPYVTNPGSREVIFSADSELRKIKRFDTLRVEVDGMMMY